MGADWGVVFEVFAAYGFHLRGMGFRFEFCVHGFRVDVSK